MSRSAVGTAPAPHLTAGERPADILRDAVAGTRASLYDAWLADGPDGLDDVCRYALGASGKLLRPALLRLAARAVGGDWHAVLPAALGTEFGHVASLVHDDVIDGDAVRRGRASVHAAYGVDRAIVAGDALLFGLFGALAECRTTGIPDARIVGALAAVAAAGVDMCRGQLLEAGVTGDLDCSVETYLDVARWKTGALFRGACASGAILGGAPPSLVDALAKYGEALGVAFQVRDDLLAYTSTPVVTGKAATSDLRNRRATLPVLLAVAACPRHRAAVECAFAAPTDAAFARLLEVLHESGALAAAARIAADHATHAEAALEALPLTASRVALARVARAAVERDR
ncbi:MAG TPA: polyprenyl synthetase family protein [Mycobacteriales bacterium]|nr:polyprenyl synthetase family protein [Mycobacteriales bacterium]